MVSFKITNITYDTYDEEAEKHQTQEDLGLPTEMVVQIDLQGDEEEWEIYDLLTYQIENQGYGWLVESFDFDTESKSAEDYDAEGFAVFAGRGFQMEFPNGYRVSVVFAPGNYGDHHDNTGDMMEHSLNPPQEWESRTAELAVFKPEGGLLDFGDEGDQVRGWINPAFVSEMFGLAAKGDEEGMKELAMKSHLYGAEGLEFTDWANQETKHHGKTSLKEWADHEIKTHGGKMSFQDWAKHEDKSHIRRFGVDGTCGWEGCEGQRYCFHDNGVGNCQNCGERRGLQELFVDDETGNGTCDYCLVPKRYNGEKYKTVLGTCVVCRSEDGGRGCDFCDLAYCDSGCFEEHIEDGEADGRNCDMEHIKGKEGWGAEDNSECDVCSTTLSEGTIDLRCDKGCGAVLCEDCGGGAGNIIHSGWSIEGTCPDGTDEEFVCGNCRVEYDAEELKKDSCCCGATKSNPCACMIQGVMECNATCPCSLEKKGAEECEYCGTKEEEELTEIREDSWDGPRVLVCDRCLDIAMYGAEGFIDLYEDRPSWGKLYCSTCKKENRDYHNQCLHCGSHNTESSWDNMKYSQYPKGYWIDRDNYPELYSAENWGGDPTGKLALMLQKVRDKAKKPKKPLKIEKLDADSLGYSYDNPPDDEDPLPEWYEEYLEDEEWKEMGLTEPESFEDYSKRITKEYDESLELGRRMRKMEDEANAERAKRGLHPYDCRCDKCVKEHYDRLEEEAMAKEEEEIRALMKQKGISYEEAQEMIYDAAMEEYTHRHPWDAETFNADVKMDDWAWVAYYEYDFENMRWNKDSDEMERFRDYRKELYGVYLTTKEAKKAFNLLKGGVMGRGDWKDGTIATQVINGWKEIYKGSSVAKTIPVEIKFEYVPIRRFGYDTATHTKIRNAETSGQWEIGEQLEEAQMNAENFEGIPKSVSDLESLEDVRADKYEMEVNFENEDMVIVSGNDLKAIIDDGWDLDSVRSFADAGMSLLFTRNPTFAFNAESFSAPTKGIDTFTQPFEESSLDSGTVKKVLVGLGIGGLALFGYNKWK